MPTMFLVDDRDSVSYPAERTTSRTTTYLCQRWQSTKCRPTELSTDEDSKVLFHEHVGGPWNLQV